MAAEASTRIHAQRAATPSRSPRGTDQYRWPVQAGRPGPSAQCMIARSNMLPAGCQCHARHSSWLSHACWAYHSKRFPRFRQTQFLLLTHQQFSGDYQCLLIRRDSVTLGA